MELAVIIVVGLGFYFSGIMAGYVLFREAKQAIEKNTAHKIADYCDLVASIDKRPDAIAMANSLATKLRQCSKEVL